MMLGRARPPDRTLRALTLGALPDRVTVAKRGGPDETWLR